MTPAILLVSELFPPAVGGTSALFSNIYGRLEIPVVVLSNGQPHGQERHPGSKSTRRWTRINGRLRGLRSFAELEQTWRISRLARKEVSSSGQLIVHTGRPLPEGLSALAAKLVGPHGPSYICWVHGEDLAVALTSREHSLLARMVCRNAALVFCSSEFAASLVRSVGVEHQRIRTIHPGVDTDRFSPSVDGAAERRALSLSGPTLLTVGRLQRRKGHDLTIAAVAKLAARIPGLRYVIAGDGSERQRLIELSVALGVSEQVIFLGGVNDERLPGLYAACDLFVMPNRVEDQDVEGFGIVYLEAAATGRASIGGRSGGVPEAILHDHTGLLVSGTDEAELADAICALLEDDNRRHRMGTAGRARVCKDFTWAVAAEKVARAHAEAARMIGKERP